MQEPSFTDIWQMIHRRWRLLMVIIFLSLACGFVLLRILPQQYTATMIIGPTATDGVAGRGARLTLQTPQTEIFRSAAVETDRNESLSDFARFLELLTSPEVIKALDDAEQGAFLRTLYADQWNEAEQQWAPPLAATYFIRAFIQTLVGQSFWSPPTYVLAAKDLQHHIKVEPIGVSAMRKISYRHSDREFAVFVLNNLYLKTDHYLKKQARKRTKAEIDYLKKALASISVIEHRRALTSLLAMQEQTQMMIAVDLPFAADQIEKATASSMPDWPNPFSVLAVFLAAGLIAGLFVVYVLETARHE